MNTKTLKFTDNAVKKARPDSFETITIDLKRVVKSWSDSIFSFEWLEKDGSVKALEDLSERDRERRESVEKALKNGDAINTPVLGIGLQDHVEIGSGRAEILTLYDHGIKTMPVHIPVSNKDDFEDFLATA